MCSPKQRRCKQVCVDLMLWSGQGRNREFYDVATLGAVARVTGGRVTYLRDEEAGGAETALNLREQLEASLRDHEHAANETVLKVRPDMVAWWATRPSVLSSRGDFLQLSFR